jgi:hypothetical protein
MNLMGDSVTTWLVQLGIGDTTEIKGTLSLEDEAVRFADEEGNEARIPLESIRRVRRVRLSPIIVVLHEGDDGPARTAFYFVKPPPLEPPATSRTSRRRSKRTNTNYLSREAVDRKPEIKAWATRIRAAAARSGTTE